MEKSELKYIYGPVYSWRIGMSLGIDPISQKRKICNFNCVYCQLGRTVQFCNKREDFVSVEGIVKEINSLPPVHIDYYTFSGRGEPTLAKNLGAMIQAVREATKGKIAVITNAALMDDEKVRKDLMSADLVLAKLDACDEESLSAINMPAEGIAFQRIVEGIKSFRRECTGKLALQIMFVEQNRKCASAIAEIARAINPDEIQINTPLRPSGTSPLNEEDLKGIKKHFKGLPVTTVYEAERRDIQPFDDKETIRRHGSMKKKKKSE